jgi:hypothetical protein
MVETPSRGSKRQNDIIIEPPFLRQKFSDTPVGWVHGN